MPSWNHEAVRNSGSSRILLPSLIKWDIIGGGVVAELLVLASPELNPEDPFRLLLHPGLTIRSAESKVCLIESTFQFPGRLSIKEKYLKYDLWQFV